MGGKSLVFICLALCLTFVHGNGSCDKVKAQCNASPIGTNLRNPDDCGSFCKCDGTTAVLMDCPAGLHFCLATDRCEYPEVAGCIPGPDPPKPTPKGCELVEYLCPAKNREYATLLANPSDCGSYCACDWGKSIWMPCPEGLHFNARRHVCDWPNRARCSGVFAKKA